MIGTFTTKIVIKDDYIRKSGMCPLYVQVFINSERKRIPLNINVQPKDFDKKRGLIRNTMAKAPDYNLILKKSLGDINQIAINYRLQNKKLSIKSLMDEINDPTSQIDFLKFFEHKLNTQKSLEKIRLSTFKQQRATLCKLKKFQESILFSELSSDLLDRFVFFMKKKMGNNDTTVAVAMKNVKKYLHLAKKSGITTPLDFKDIKVRATKGSRTFLDGEELKKIFRYYNSEFINSSHKSVLKKFLFSCFTGLRISDIQKLKQDDYFENYIIFIAQKTNKIQKIPLNKTAQNFINTEGTLFDDDFRDQTINDYLKDIARICGIKKRVTFHVGRHTFATQFLIIGGKVEVLQKLMGHSKMETTMIYVHIVDTQKEDQISQMDTIFNF